MRNGSVGRLVEQAMQDGWAVGDGRLDSGSFRAFFLRWEGVPSRMGGPVIDELKPTKPEDAPQSSLSAKYGQAEQPLHTDGAHSTQPPDVVFLSVAAASNVPTLLWRFGPEQVPKEEFANLSNGLFTIRSGKDAFLAPAWNGRRLRFDPGCMVPGDQRARRVLAFLKAARRDAERFEWTTSGKVLVIDNRRTLHARASAECEPGRIMYRAAVRMSGDAR